MFDIAELCEFEEEFKAELEEHLTEILARLNRMERIEELLEILGLQYLLKDISGYSVRNTGKIVVIGHSEVAEEVLASIMRQYGIDKKRIEFCLDYEATKTYNFTKMQWNPDYSLVLVGPMPHSGNAKGESGSIIAALEHEAGYPPVVRLGSNQLKITKSDFKEKIGECIETKLIA
ncbi:MAG: hypothetical protein PHR06_16380 [Candidatus Cloacimonetes bacterium]|nr:hypothetical protein [Candidatus Cloacimonadota bacterium]